MKLNRQGKARVLDKDELDLLIDCLPTNKHKLIALVCRRTACRISEAIQLRWENVLPNVLFFPIEITKNKLSPRSIPVSKEFQLQLKDWKDYCESMGESINPKDYLFKGRYPNTHLSSRAFMKALKAATLKAGLIGTSSHSFRRSGLSSASNANIPLRHIQELSGHRNLGTLQRYLSVNDSQLRAAADAMA
tara:strand:- start:25 stop:597 length:573 start_codon:yes stop_codon:yes gene_type:complete